MATKKSQEKSPAPTGPPEHSCWTYVWSLAQISIVIGGIAMAQYYIYKDARTPVIARQSDIHGRKLLLVECGADYDEDRKKWPNCAPATCARLISDTAVSTNDVKRLLKIAKKGFALGGGSGGASILDLHSGALSKGDQFVNIYTLSSKLPVFSEDDFLHYKYVRQRVQHAVASAFNISEDKIYLTKPTFFSRITNKEARTVHDQYWHVHVDKETYGSFIYTSLLYLSDYNNDFQGGRFWFTAPLNISVEPRLGRLMAFTSGSENPHRVEMVTGGTRYAATISFTCDPTLAIDDPMISIKS